MTATLTTAPIDTTFVPVTPEIPTNESFLPIEPDSFREAGLGEHQIEGLILKTLLAIGTASGREIADQVALPFRLIERLLHMLKADRLVVFKAGAPVCDYTYELTELGTERAQRYWQQSAYCGAAPVSLDDYVASVEAQSVTRQNPQMADLQRAFSDLLLGDDILGRLGEAMNSGLGFFLFGSPGNGKTSIARRVTAAYGETIWIPKAILACGEIVYLYDSVLHEVVPIEDGEFTSDEREQIDRRWVRIRRPTIVVGGELTLENLEVTTNPVTGVREAPLHLKSNCGTLVIDDFGRQQVSPRDLLNRWVTPLESRHDFLSSAAGRKFQVPFDQMIIFSTNLEPRDLVDEAFLRRIPYKIDVADPTEIEFREVCRREAAKFGVVCDDAAVDHLIARHYREAGRGFRFCHPRDLMQQVRTAATFRNVPAVATPETLDAAVRNYFAVN